MPIQRLLLCSSLIACLAWGSAPVSAQEAPAPAPQVASAPAPAAETAQAPEPLTDEELEILVARIALYPDELVALIAAASLYPLEIVEAERFLGDLKTDKSLKPKADWDGSVISLLNYPEIVTMMSEDLDWTKAMGAAIVNQQDDVLAAIQQLREKAVANNVLKSDDKMKVSEESGNIVIAPASKEVIYVPQYPPEMLYEVDYTYQPITYYPDPYPYYYYPGAGFFAGAITGIFWGAIIDWDDGFWGGDWDWGDGDFDFDFDCNQCIIGNDFTGKINLRDADWRNIDRSKINFDKNKLSQIDRTQIKNKVGTSDRNRLKNKGQNIGADRPATLPGKGDRQVKDVRASTLEGLKKQPGAKPGAAGGKAKPGQAGKRPAAGNKVAAGGGNKKPASANRPAGKKKAGAKADTRPRNPSPVGDMSRGSSTKRYSDRGYQSMGGGYSRPSYGGGGGQSFKQRPMPRGGGGGRGGGGRGRR